MSYYGAAEEGKRRDRKTGGPACNACACIACIERPNLTCRHTEEERGKSHTRCDIGSEDRQGKTTQRGQNAVMYVVEGGGEEQSGWMLFARGVSPSRGGPMLQSGAEVAWPLYLLRRDER